MFIEEGTPRIPPQTIVEGLPNALLYYIAHEYELQATNHNYLSLGTGAYTAIGAALSDIYNNDADIMLAGGHDSWIDWTAISHQLFSRDISAQTDDPDTVFRPYDVRRSGGVAGEGAGLAVVEELNAARERGAEIFGELLAYSGATGVPSTDRQACADALSQCIRRALDEVQLSPADIDVIFLHGGATAAADWSEVHGILSALGEAALRIPATTVKSSTGLLGNGSCVTELALAAEALRRGELLPIRNLEEPDPELPLNFVRAPVSGLSLRRALLLQRGWPSHYTAVVLGAAP